MGMYNACPECLPDPILDRPDIGISNMSLGRNSLPLQSATQQSATTAVDHHCSRSTVGGGGGGGGGRYKLINTCEHELAYSSRRNYP